MKSLDAVGRQWEVAEGVEAVEGALVDQLNGVDLQLELLQAPQPAELVLPQLSQVAGTK